MIFGRRTEAQLPGLSADGRSTVTASTDGVRKVWDTTTVWATTTGTVAATWFASSAVSALATTSAGPDDAVLVAGDSGGSVHILELRQAGRR